MANLDYYSPLGVFSLVYAPKIIFETNVERYFSRSQDAIGELNFEFDLFPLNGGVSVAYTTNLSVGGYGSWSVGDLELHLDGAIFQSIERTILKTNNIPYVGTIYTNQSQTLEWQPRILVGGSYSFRGLVILAEYYYNGAGFDSAEWQSNRNLLHSAADHYSSSDSLSLANLGTSMQFLTAYSPIALAQHYAMMRVYSTKFSEADLALTGILNLEDGSGRIMCSGGYSGWKTFSFSGSVYRTFGSDDGEFMLYGNIWGVNLDFEFSL